MINEQSSSQSKDSGEITVSALHVVIDGVADVIISSAHADIVCRGPDERPVNDFVTGGGWITGTPSGKRANFGVAGGLKNGALWGHLVYHDHGNGMKVKGTAVTEYSAVGTTTRMIRGTCDIDGVPGTYQVVVSDNGEPGRMDSLELSLSNGYRADPHDFLDAPQRRQVF